MVAKQAIKPSWLNSPRTVGFLASCIFFSLLPLLPSVQAASAAPSFPSDKTAGFQRPIAAREAASLTPTACHDTFPHSHTTPSDARHGVIAAAASFVRRLQKEAATLADQLMLWVCAAKAMGGEEEHQSVRHLSRFHSAVARLSAIVEPVAGSRVPPVSEAVTSSSLHPTPSALVDSSEVLLGDDAQEASITTVDTQRTEQGTRHQVNLALSAKWRPDPSPVFPPSMSRPVYQASSQQGHNALPLEQQAGDKSSARILAVPLEAQREALCNISRLWNISDWQAKCTQGAAITNAWEGVGYSNAQEAVTALTLSGKRLNGTIPDVLSALAALEHLQLGSNAITGALPPSLFHLSLLTFLDLSNNRLSGSIPPGITDVSRLQELRLPMNQLRGTVPGEIAILTALVYVSFENNELSGSIPGQLSALTALTALFLQHNELTGTIPGQLSALTALRYLYLHTNQLVGTIPKQLSALTALWSCYLSTNVLSGTIPGELSALTSLRSLYLSNNELSGTIPGKLSVLGALRDLWLPKNQLSGIIPRELEGLTALRYLSLYMNQLTGTIPRELSVLTALNGLDFYNNELTGTIPRELSALTALHGLGLSTNELSGTIPQELSTLAALRALYLYNNKLSGTIPGQLSALTALTDLVLYNNRLSGILPVAFASLKALTRLDAHNTRVHGVALGLQQWLTSLAVFAAAGTPLAQSSCGGFPDVVYDAALRMCVASNFLPNTEGACGDMVFLTASPVSATHSVGIATIPPAGTASATFLRHSLPLPCRYSKDYDLLSSVHILFNGPSQYRDNEEKAEDNHWLTRGSLLLQDSQGFQGNVALYLPLWGDMAWGILATKDGADIGAGGNTALEMRAASDNVAPWHVNVTFPPSILPYMSVACQAFSP